MSRAPPSSSAGLCPWEAPTLDALYSKFRNHLSLSLCITHLPPGEPATPSDPTEGHCARRSLYLVLGRRFLPTLPAARAPALHSESQKPAGEHRGPPTGGAQRMRPWPRLCSRTSSAKWLHRSTTAFLTFWNVPRGTDQEEHADEATSSHGISSY